MSIESVYVGEPKLLTNLEVLETVNQQLDLLGVEFDGTEKTKTALGENNLLEYVWLLQRTKEYLRSSSTHLQDSESIAAFLADLKAFPIQFTKEEIFQLVNIVPTTQIIEDCAERMTMEQTEELLDLIGNHFPKYFKGMEDA